MSPSCCISPISRLRSFPHAPTALFSSFFFPQLVLHLLLFLRSHTLSLSLSLLFAGSSERWGSHLAGDRQVTYASHFSLPRAWAGLAEERPGGDTTPPPPLARSLAHFILWPLSPRKQQRELYILLSVLLVFSHFLSLPHIQSYSPALSNTSLAVEDLRSSGRGWSVFHIVLGLHLFLHRITSWGGARHQKATGIIEGPPLYLQVLQYTTNSCHLKHISTFSPSHMNILWDSITIIFQLAPHCKCNFLLIITPPLASHHQPSHDQYLTQIHPADFNNYQAQQTTTTGDP